MNPQLYANILEEREIYKYCASLKCGNVDCEKEDCQGRIEQEKKVVEGNDTSVLDVKEYLKLKGSGNGQLEALIA